MDDKCLGGQMKQKMDYINEITNECKWFQLMDHH
jgi:hypothetical protein